MSNVSHKLGRDPIYDLNQISIPRRLILGLQHCFAMFGATILVPLITGLNIQTTLLMAGLGTLLFHLLTKGKVPAFLGSSFAFIGGYAAVAPKLADGSSNVEKLAYASGGVMIAGLVYLLIAGLIKVFSIERVMSFFPPVVTGPIIMAIGLTLTPAAIGNASQDWLLAGIAILIIVLCNIWGKGMFQILPILIGISVTYVIAILLNRVDFAPLSQSAIVGLPLHPQNFARFDLSAIITIVPITLATIMEHVGDISAIGATVGKKFVADPGLHRTLMGDGLATTLAAAVGAPANTTYGENTGVLVLTKVYDPKVMRIAACFAIGLSFFPVIANAISSIPAGIIGGISMVLYGMITAIGGRNLVENRVDLSKSRNLLIVASILILALGFPKGVSFHIGQLPITLSGLALASLVGIILNAIFPGKDYHFTSEKPQATGVEFSGTHPVQD